MGPHGWFLDPPSESVLDWMSVCLSLCCPAQAVGHLIYVQDAIIRRSGQTMHGKHSSRQKGHVPNSSFLLLPCQYTDSLPPISLLNHFREFAQETASRRSEHTTRAVTQCHPHPRHVPPPLARPRWACWIAASAWQRVPASRRSRSSSTRTASTWRLCRGRTADDHGNRNPVLIRWVCGRELATNYIGSGVSLIECSRYVVQLESQLKHTVARLISCSLISWSCYSGCPHNVRDDCGFMQTHVQEVTRSRGVSGGLGDEKRWYSRPRKVICICFCCSYSSWSYWDLRVSSVNETEFNKSYLCITNRCYVT